MQMYSSNLCHNNPLKSSLTFSIILQVVLAGMSKVPRGSCEEDEFIHSGEIPAWVSRLWSVGFPQAPGY